MSARNHSPITDPRVLEVLESLHRKAGRQLPGVVRHIAGRALKSVFSKSAGTYDDTAYYRDKLIPIDRRQGGLIYLLCRSLGAKRAVEFGTSFGVSTLYLASAVRDNGAGVVIGTEIEPDKAKIARGNFDAAGVSSFVDLREGDAFETLKDCGGEVDFLLVDGWPKFALAALKLVLPQMRKGGIIFCDQSGHAPSDRRAYEAFVRNPANGLASMHLPLYGGTELTVKVG